MFFRRGKFDKKQLLVILLAVVVWVIYYLLWVPPFTKPVNLLKNNSFEKDSNKDGIPDFWGEKKYNSVLSKNSQDKKYSLLISNKKAEMAVGSQMVEVDGRKSTLVSVSGYVKADNIIVGDQSWKNAKIQVLFYDKNNKQIGGWPEVQGLSGSFDWKLIKKVFMVPRATRFVEINIGLWECSGDIYFDNLKVEITRAGEVDPYNYVVNGNFEVWQGWVYGGSPFWALEYPGYNGDSSLYIKNDVKLWSFASQSIKLPKDANKLEASAYIKCKNVIRGDNPWDEARLNLEFKDEDGNRVGGYPVVASLTGTSDWALYEKSFDVPVGAVKVEVFSGLLNCEGQVWFDDVSINILSEDGSRQKSLSNIKTDVTDWYAFSPESVTFNSFTKMSWEHEKPAGKKGFVKVKNGKFHFENGDRAKFFGVNVYGSDLFLSKSDAVKMADRIESLGVNLVRIHHLDAAWANPNIFNSKENNTLTLSKENLDKIDFFVSELISRGIYIYLDLLVHRGFKKGDGVDDHDKIGNGAKISAFVDRRIIELQKQYAKQLLTHKNPYTGKAYINEPAIVMTEIINESSLFYIGQQTWLPESVQNKLDKKWTEWLTKKYKSHEKIDEVYVNKYGVPLLSEDEVLANGTIKRGVVQLKKYRASEAKIDPRVSDTLEFYYYLQINYFNEMYSYLKRLGVKFPIAGSNHWESIDADLKANSTLDFIDRHMYWNHPKFGYGVSVAFDNKSMLKYPAKSIPAVMASQRVADKPFVVSEWNTCWPGDYYIEGPVLMASYAKLQDWDAVIYFSFNKNQFSETISDNFDSSALPNVLAQIRQATYLFFSDDISVAKTSVVDNVPDSALFDKLINENSAVFNNYLYALKYKVSKRFSERKSTLPRVLDSKTIKSEDNTLKWDSESGVFTVDAQKVKGALGFLADRLVPVGFIRFVVNNKFASVFFRSLDNKELSKSSKILLTVSGSAENRGMIYNSMKTQIIDIGDSPILIEGINAEVQLKGSNYSVYSLGFSGEKKTKLKSDYKNGFTTFNLSASDGSQYYLLEKI